MCKKLLSILLAVSMLCSAALAITDEEFEQLTGNGEHAGQSAAVHLQDDGMRAVSC